MEMQISNTYKTLIAGIIIKDNESDNKVKYENMYNIICPLDKFVLNRIIRVKGRISWEKISIRGSKSINPTGAPYGSMWDKNSLSWEKDTQIIIGTQKSKDKVRVSE